VFSRFRSWVHSVFARRRLESDMNAELRQHMANFAEDLVRSGVPRAEAERRARIEFGSVAAAKEECRQARGLRFLDELRQDLRYAFRTLAASPGLTAVAVISLALGIGANTSIFSLIDTVLLRFLPVHEPQQLYFLAHGSADDPSTGSNYRLLEHFRATTGVFSGIAASTDNEFKVRNGDAIDLVYGQFVSGNYFELLGAPMALGRSFAYESDTEPQRLAAVISDAYWQRRFGRDPAVLGKALIVEDHTVEIIGVTHPEFFGLYPGFRVDITVPLSMKATLGDAAFFTRFDNWTSMPLVGRLRPGVSEAEALASVDFAFQQFMDTPESKWAKEMDPKHFSNAALLPASKGLAELRQRFSKPLLVLMGMVGLVLLIACANIANLLLARATARTKEMAVRLSMGAGRLRVLRQLLTESLLLALLGGAAGILVAAWATQSLVSLIAAGQTPIRLDVHLDERVLLFTLAACVFTGTLFGLVPALRATRVDLAQALKESPSTGGEGKRRGAKALVAVQVALSVLLLSATGLLVRTLYNLKTQGSGFDGTNVVLLELDPRAANLSPAGTADFYEGLLGRIQRLPGVLSASFSTLSPASRRINVRGIVLPGLTESPDSTGAWYNVTSPGYFRTLGIELLRGRDFGEQDRAGAPRAAIVNETMARFYFGSADVVGRRFAFRSEPESTVEIIGVVQDARQHSLRAAAPRMVYVPWGQGESLGRLTAEIRAVGDPRPLAGAVQAEVRDRNKDVIVGYVRTMAEQVDASLVQERMLAMLSAAFGGLALLLACIGLYGVMAYSVVRRTREMGIRMALGAAHGLVLWHVLRESLWLALLGVLMGVPLALWAAPQLGDLLYELSPRDPAIFFSTVAALVAVAALAGYLPARRASRIAPAIALRHE